MKKSVFVVLDAATRRRMRQSDNLLTSEVVKNED